MNEMIIKLQKEVVNLAVLASIGAFTTGMLIGIVGSQRRTIKSLRKQEKESK